MDYYITYSKKKIFVWKHYKYYFTFRDNELSEIEPKHNEVRDLIVSRNELVHFLSKYETEPINTESQQIQNYGLMKLPDPLTRKSICEKCEYALICAAYHCNSAKTDKSYPIHKIGEKILRHLSKEDFEYFFKWTEILLKEEEALSKGIIIILIGSNPYINKYPLERSLIYNLCLKHSTK